METINITNPGNPPIEGDIIQNIYPNGTIEQKQFHVIVEIPPSIELTFIEFFTGRFTPEEIIAIYKKSREDSDAGILCFAILDFFKQAQGIIPNHQNTIQGLNTWVSIGVLTAERASQIQTI